MGGEYKCPTRQRRELTETTEKFKASYTLDFTSHLSQRLASLQVNKFLATYKQVGAVWGRVEAYTTDQWEVRGGVGEN